MVFYISDNPIGDIEKDSIVYAERPRTRENQYLYKVFLSDSEIDWNLDSSFSVVEGKTIRDTSNIVLIEQ